MNRLSSSSSSPTTRQMVDSSSSSSSLVSGQQSKVLETLWTCRLRENLAVVAADPPSNKRSRPADDDGELLRKRSKRETQAGLVLEKVPIVNDDNDDDNDKVHRLRQQVLRAIEDRAQRQTARTDDGSSNSSHASTPPLRALWDDASFARGLERVLFRTTGGSSSIEEYAQPETLNPRLHALLGALVRRRARKVAAAHNRAAQLQTVVGGAARYHELLALKQRVQRAQQGSLGGSNNPNDDSSSTCGAGCGSSSSIVQHSSCRGAVVVVRGGGEDEDEAAKMPAPIRRLFFHTRLVHAMDRDPIENRSGSSSSTYWKELEEEAVRHLEEYQAWVVSSSSSPQQPQHSAAAAPPPDLTSSTTSIHPHCGSAETDKEDGVAVVCA